MKNTTQTEIAARCTRAASRPFDTKGGPRIKAEFLTAEDETVAVFADAASMMSKAGKGDAVVLYKGMRGWEFSAFDFAAQAATVQPPGPSAGNPAPETAGRKQEIADYIAKQAKCFAYCLAQVSGNPDMQDLADSDRRAIATTLYIQTVRKFNL